MARSSTIGTLAVNVVANTGKFNRGMSSVRKTTKATAASLTAIKVGATALVGGLVLLGREYEKLNKTMNRSLAIMGNVSKSMRKDMTQAAIEVARTTNASASQAAEGFFFLASAGLDAEQSLAALPRVAKFAQAGNFDLALATDLLTDAQSALGMTVKDNVKNMENMGRVSDVLVKANTLANATVQQFSEALTNKAGAALRIVGKDVEEGAAVLAVFADQGVKGAEGGVALNIVMRDLQTKSIKFRSDFAKAGIAVFDTTGEMRNMADIVSDLEGRLTGLSDVQKKTTLLDLGFADKSVAFIQALVGTSEKIRDYEQALRGAGGATSAVADKQLTNLEKATNKLGAAFAQLGTKMAPVVDKLAALIESTADFLAAFGKFGRVDLSTATGKSKEPLIGGVSVIEGGFTDRLLIGLDELIAGAQLTTLTRNHTTPAQFVRAFETLGASEVRDVGPRTTAAGGKFSQFRTHESSVEVNAKRLVAAASADANANAERRLAAAERRRGQQELSQKGFDAVGNGIGNVLDSIQSNFGALLVGKFKLDVALAKAQGIAFRAGANPPAAIVNRRGPLAALEAGTAEAFAASRKNINPARDADIEVQKSQLEVQKEMAVGIAALVENKPMEFGIE